MKNSDDLFIAMMSLIMVFVIALVMIFGVNSCTKETWNDGYCNKCEVRYELKCVYKGLKYYSCPECGNEVHRY